MQRRKFIAGMGSLAAAAGAAVGTGAFTSVQADRTVNVEVTSDSNAFLSINPGDGPNGQYATEAGDGTLALDFTSKNETDVGGQGVNADSDTEINNVFTITNQGTQNIRLEAGSPGAIGTGGGPPSMVATVGPDEVDLGVGDKQSYDVELKAKSAEPGDELDAIIEISAEATEE